MSDLVERLRVLARAKAQDWDCAVNVLTEWQAADRIEALEAHVAWLADGVRELQSLTDTGADRSVLIATAERVLDDFEGEQ